MKILMTILVLFVSCGAFADEDCWKDSSGEIHCRDSGDIRPHW